MRNEGYDIIGDIHGHAEELKALLETLGYQNQEGCYRHPEREAIFLGDFIDRGPAQMEVLNIVMPMCAQGAARSIMGNHEFNALAFHTPNPEQQEAWLRPRTDKNIKQHLRFLERYLNADDENELKQALDFFWSLPLWLELDGFRVVHACWAQRHIEALGNDNRLSIERLVQASDQTTREYDAIEALLKGVEIKVPEEDAFLDKDNHSRTAVRTQWWHNTDSTVGEIAFPKGGLDGKPVANKVIHAKDLVGYGESEKPVFIGHYWIEGAPQIMAPNVACLDYSVAKGGRLVAYKWDGEQTLSNSKFKYAQ